MSRITIRFKIMLWYAALTGLLLVIFISALYQSLSKSLYNDPESVLRVAMSQISADLKVENNAVSYDEGVQLPPDVYIIIVDFQGRVVYQNNNRLNWLGDAPFVIGKMRILEKNTASWMVFDNVIANEGKDIAYIRVSSSLEDIQESLTNIKLLLLFAIPAFLALAVFGGFFIAHKALMPISKITKTAQRIENGDLSERINDINSRDEVGQLASAFNSMLNKLEVSFKREKQFASDASHELRTPVAIVMAYSEVLMDRLQANSVDNDEFEESLRSIHKESKRMNRVISQLLMLTRGYEGKYQLEIEAIDLRQIIENIIEHLKETAEESNISLTYSVDSDIALMADQSLITQMLINLIENGIKYGRPGGFVQLSAQQGADNVQVTVEDDGIGIAENELPLIFDRFYRTNKSRDRNGTGLGLSIVKWIVQAHYGKIFVDSQSGKGTVFKIVL